VSGAAPVSASWRLRLATGQSKKAALSNMTANFATLSAKADAARDADRLEEAESLYKKALALRPRWAEDGGR